MEKGTKEKYDKGANDAGEAHFEIVKFISAL
jgi:hypothetical protein